MRSLRRQQASDIIREHFQSLKGVGAGTDVLVSARGSGRRMVEIYRLLTGEMPQAPGIEAEYYGDETPAVEFASPTERDPNETYYVVTGRGEDPDVLIKGDQNGSSKQGSKEGDQESVSEGEQAGRSVRRLSGHRD